MTDKNVWTDVQYTHKKRSISGQLKCVISTIRTEICGDFLDLDIY